MSGWPRPPLPPRWAHTPVGGFVGRRNELSVLEAAWSAACRGERQVVLLGGEPGAGKSRLLAEVGRALHGAGAGSLLGGCVEDFGASYQPFVEPLAALLPDLADGRLQRAPTGGVSAVDDDDRLLERLATLLGRRSGRPDGCEKEYRRGLYGAAAAAVRAAAQQHPLVLALEDLHWASPAALQLLTHLVESTAESRLLVLVTHRTTAPDRSPALVGTLAQLARVEGVRRLDLAGLGAEEITDYLVAEAGLPRQRARAPASLLRDQTGGNPFFLRELWRDLASRGGLADLRAGSTAAPASVCDTVERRLRRLETPHRQTLELAAVIGEDLDVATLLGAADWSPEVTLTALDEAVACGLLEELGGGEGGFRFAHSLARQAVLTLMAPSRRVRQHARVASVLEQAPPELRDVQQLAYHYASSAVLGYRDRAVHYLTEAARGAEHSLAHEDAARWYEQAGALVADAARRDALRLAGARSHLLAGDFRRARELAEQVATSGRPRDRLHAALSYEDASWRPGLPGHRSVELLTGALRDVPHDAGDADYLRGLASLGRALAFTGATEQAAQLGQRALDLARASGRQDLLAHALQASLWQGLRPQDVPAKLQRATELSRLAESPGHLDHLGPAAYYRGVIAYTRGDADGLSAAHRDLLHMARATGQGFFDYMAGCVDYGRQFVAGQFAAAERSANRLLDLGESFGTDDTEGPYGVQVFMVRRETGVLEQVRPLITGQERPTEHWAPGLLAVYTELGLQPASSRLLWWLLDHDLARYQGSAQWPGVLAFLVETALALEDHRAARVLRPALAEHAGLNLLAGQFVALFGSADRYLGQVDSLLGQGAPEESFAAARSMDTAMEAPVHQAHTLVAQVVHARRVGADRHRVADLVEEARSLAEPLRLHRVLRLLDQADPSASRHPAPDGLTDRELEVLGLLSEGLTNRRIGQQLRVTENTAANHVRSILAKTGSANRTTAARYAAERGLG